LSERIDHEAGKRDDDNRDNQDAHEAEEQGWGADLGYHSAEFSSHNLAGRDQGQAQQRICVCFQLGAYGGRP
jgi:hypothetical protein